MSTITVVIKKKGGVGATEMAINLILAMIAKGQKPGVAELDQVNRLSSVLGPDYVNLSIKATPDLKDQLKTRSALLALCDPMYALAYEHDHVVFDVGANGASDIFRSWAEQSELRYIAKDDGNTFEFVVPITAENSSLVSGYNEIVENHALFGADARYYLVRNDLTGDGFETMEGQSFWKSIQRLQKEIDLTILDVGHLHSDLATIGKTRGKSMAQMRQIGKALLDNANNKAGLGTDKDMIETAKGLGIYDGQQLQAQKLLITRQLRDLDKWLNATRKALYPIHGYDPDVQAAA